MNLPADPLDVFENSMEQPIPPEMDVFADPFCRALDNLEHSIENQGLLGLPLSDPLHQTLDGLENETNQQDSQQPTWELAGEINRPESKPSTQDLEEAPAVRQYSMPVPRIKGRGGSGVRNTRDESGCYCYLHEMWVLENECDDCPDFEQDEYTPENEEKRCKHSVFRLSEDLGE